MRTSHFDTTSAFMSRTCVASRGSSRDPSRSSTERRNLQPDARRALGLEARTSFSRACATCEAVLRPAAPRLFAGEGDRAARLLVAGGIAPESGSPRPLVNRHPPSRLSPGGVGLAGSTATRACQLWTTQRRTQSTWLASHVCARAQRQPAHHESPGGRDFGPVPRRRPCGLRFVLHRTAESPIPSRARTCASMPDTLYPSMYYLPCVRRAHR
jgi:hypothetical protein